jgi:hypothetical protein
VTPDRVPWTDSPVIPNSKGAFLVGNPQKAEVTVLRVKLPEFDNKLPYAGFLFLSAAQARSEKGRPSSSARSEGLSAEYFSDWPSDLRLGEIEARVVRLGAAIDRAAPLEHRS